MSQLAGTQWQHRKGGVYTVIAEGVNETDLTPVIIYQAAVDGVIWVRPKEEFMDGRFTRLDKHTNEGGIMKKLCYCIVAACAAILIWLAAAAPAKSEEIGSVDTAFNLFGNHRVVIEVFDDPKVPGVSCFLSRPVAGGISGAVGLAEEKSDASIACRQTGPIDATALYGSAVEGEDVFEVSTSPLFKTLNVARFFDEERNTIVYLTYSTYLIDGSPKNSVSAVTIMPW